jgi:uncharacterized protein YoxC
MNAGQLAALIAAVFFAVGVCVGVYVLFRLARLISVATTVVTGYQLSAEELLRRSHEIVDRADEQLARTGALADSVEQVTASMTDLSEQVSAVAGTARLIAVGLGTPVLRLAAFGHGIRGAIAMRRSRHGTALTGRGGAQHQALRDQAGVRRRALHDRAEVRRQALRSGAER